MYSPLYTAVGNFKVSIVIASSPWQGRGYATRLRLGIHFDDHVTSLPLDFKSKVCSRSIVR